MKLALVLLAVIVAAAGSLLVAGRASPAGQPTQVTRVLLTPETGLMPEVVVTAPRPEMVVDEVLVTAPRPESPPADVWANQARESGSKAN